MKIKYLTALFAGLLFAGALQANVLSNSSFETPGASGGDFSCSANGGTGCTGWTGFESALINSNLFDDGQRGPQARTGTQTIKMFGPFGQPTSGVFQDSTAIEGEVWGASAFIQNWDDPDGVTGGDPMQGDNLGQLQLIFKDSGGADLLVVSQEFDAGQPRNIWTELTASGIAPAGTDSVRILLAHQQNEGFDGGSVYWDDASLQIVPIPAAVWLFGSALGLLGWMRRKVS